MASQQQQPESSELLKAGPPATQQDYSPYSSEAPLEPAKEQQPAEYPGGGWAAEITCAVFSILCVVAIVVILSRIDGRLLSSWTEAVSPNAVIAVLSTAAKAAMLLPVAESISQIKWLDLKRGAVASLEHLEQFDNASRGPWGALKLFWHARRSPFMFPTYLGCFVTIAAIAVDPFTQQILSFEQKATQVPGVQSSVTRSQIYDNYVSGVSGVAGVVAPTRNGLLQAAAASGVYDLVSPPPFSCPGSNCTYPAFTSLGICSKCSDVTAHTVKSCENPKEGYYIQLCNFKTPGGFSPQAFAGLDAHSGFSHTLLNISLNSPLIQDRPENRVTMGMIRFATDDAASHNATDDTYWQDTLTAYECSYDACARAYSGWTSVNGTVVPGAIQESRLNMTGGGPIVPFTALEKGFPGNTTFMINYFDLEVMSTGLAKVYDPGTDGSNSFTSALYNSPNITRTVKNIATGMSYRMLSGPNATAVTGEVFAVQTYMRANWPWLSLTTALEVFTCLFLTSVIIATSRARQHAWKSSLAPLLYDNIMIDTCK